MEVFFLKSISPRWEFALEGKEMKSVFDTHGKDSDLNSRSGQMVEVLRLLTAEEADLHETGPMYRVRFYDGTETDAFLDELPSVMEVMNQMGIQHSEEYYN